MVSVYGSPFDRGRQVSRQLRRGSPGITRGQSEAAAPVLFPRHRGNRPASSAVPGPGGTPGLPLSDELRDGGSRGFARAGGFVNPTSIGAIQSAGVMGNNSSSSGANSGTGVWFSGHLVQAGIAGRGGFMSVGLFRFNALSATRWWFVGASRFNLPTTFADVSSSLSLIGVGQDSGDTSPQFVYNDNAGAATKVSTGLPNVGTTSAYEVRVFANPRTGAWRIAFETFTAAGASNGQVLHTPTANLPDLPMGPMGFFLNNGPAGGIVTIRPLSMSVAYQPRSEITIDS